MAYIRVVPEFKTSSTRIKPLFAYASFSSVCIGNSGLSLLILTAQRYVRRCFGSLAIFLQKHVHCLLFRQEQPLFRRQMSHKFGELFSFYVHFLIC
jgi:hypothetical protein